MAHLHFKNRPHVWEFKPDPRYGTYTYTTRAGNTYGIMVNQHYAPVIWIGHLSHSSKDRVYWYNCTSKLRVKSIEFSDGGTYIFPGYNAPVSE